jgi:hypothetical protein
MDMIYNGKNWVDLYTDWMDKLMVQPSGLRKEFERQYPEQHEDDWLAFQAGYFYAKELQEGIK